MNRLSNVIDLYKESRYRTDTEMARALGVSPQYVSQARRTGKLSDEQCTAIADATGIDLAYILAARNALKSRGRIRDAWEQLAASMDKGPTIFITGIFRRWQNLMQLPVAIC